MKAIVWVAVALSIGVSKTHGGELFVFSSETVFSKRQIPPNIDGKWLFLGCKTVAKVCLRLRASGDPSYPYGVKFCRQPAEAEIACNPHEHILIRNIKSIPPGRFAIAANDSVDDSTTSYRARNDTVKVIKSKGDGKIVISFVSNQGKLARTNESFEDAVIVFAGDVNRDNRVDFVIRWMSNYSNRYELLLSKMENGAWQLKPEAVIEYVD